ncbi:MAG TPA: YeeE/YedE family protein [Polyangiaceae bacterium]
MKTVAAFFAGMIFSLGLCVSQMTDPHKVRGFLDVTGKWDPSLAFVMAGAVLVATLGFLRAKRAGKPAFAESFDLPEAKAIDAKLVIGAVLFGVGWGMSGWCPGPAIASLASPTIALGVFLAAMTVSTVLVRRFLTKNASISRS